MIFNISEVSDGTLEVFLTGDPTRITPWSATTLTFFLTRSGKGTWEMASSSVSSILNSRAAWEERENVLTQIRTLLDSIRAQSSRSLITKLAASLRFFYPTSQIRISYS